MRSGEPSPPAEVGQRRVGQSPLQRGAVPLREVGGGLIGGLQKIEKRGGGVGGLAYRVIRQDEFADFLAVIRASRLDLCVGEAGRLRIGIGIERGLAKTAIAGPKPRTADLVRIRLAIDRIRNVWVAGWRRRAAAGKARHREIEAAPEEMHRADLAGEAGAEGREDLIDFGKRAPEAGALLRVVGGVNAVLIQPDLIGDFDRYWPDMDVDTERVQSTHEFGVELRDRVRREGDAIAAAVAKIDAQHVIDKIEIDLE